MTATSGRLALTGRGESDDPPAAVLDDADRDALAPDPGRRGDPAPPRDPSVDPADAEAVARAYLAAAYSVRPDDGGATHLRAAAWAAPGTAPAEVGVLVVSPPPPGAERTAAAGVVELLAVDHDDTRRGYRAVVETRTGPVGGPAITEYVTADVVLARQPDGGWLVTSESPENPDLTVGE